MSVHTSVRSDLPKLGEKSGKLVLSAEIERTLESLLVSEVAVSVGRLVGRLSLFCGEGTGVETDCRAQLAKYLRVSRKTLMSAAEGSF